MLYGWRRTRQLSSSLGSRPAIYELQADQVVELQLEKAGERLAYLLNTALGAK
jgi:hypothetical protein